MRTKLGFATVLVALAAAAMAGCGEGDDEQQVQVEPTPEFLAQSARRTSDAQTARFEMRMIQRIDGPEDQQVVTETTTTGSFDGAAEVMAADQHQAIETPAQDLEGDGEVVQSGNDVFVRGFPWTEEPYALDEQQWALLQLPEEVSELSGLTADTGAVATPSEQLDLLLENVEDVEEVGTEDVRGVATTHLMAAYQLPEQAVEAFDELTGGAVDPPTDVPVDVWVDGDGYIRQVETGNEIGEGVGSVRTTVSTAYWDFGVEVDVEVPVDAVPLDPFDVTGAAPVDEDEPTAGEQAIAEAAEEAEEAFADQIEQRGTMSNDPADFLAGQGPEMAALAQEMRDQLTYDERMLDPCQVAEDPALRDRCEQLVVELG
jgi:hypothetical protein